MELGEDDTLAIYKNLKRLEKYKTQNMLDFMDWQRYEKQNLIRREVLDRLLYNLGSKKIFVIFGGNRSGKTETGAGIVCEYLEATPNVQIMCATVDYKLSVDVQQSKINKLLRKSKVNYGQFSPVRGFTNSVVLMKNRSKCIFRSRKLGTINR